MVYVCVCVQTVNTLKSLDSSVRFSERMFQSSAGITELGATPFVSVVTMAPSWLTVCVCVGGCMDVWV